ncbi:ATP-binding cassette domain-containing protein [Paraurantiacibacter namhicola]|uniref:Sulfate/thiosulfate import ATP-binding protein CysA n=1 Tax=Paraurantiacibacter namhicola TaxID=645517 RepID=A0A1C7DBW6_9SPHN|nr:ATP-binding cassette domain-containing protein [Paraurantiacibacter namhicola]ANU08763.1 Sulfate/thiosulfate import ATP-binding protein CysA [Paraurantiacibacter namhicola]
MRFDCDFSFCVGEGSRRLVLKSDARLVALTGPSGVGKTTALHCIAGLRQPLGGHIRIGGRALDGLAPEQRRAGVVFQDLRLFDHMSVAANLAFGARPEAGDAANLADISDMLGLGGLLDRYPANLSGGEARRVALARAILSNPDFLLLDEPMSSLDAARADRIAGLIERLRDELDIPILLVSHSDSEVARLASESVTLSASGDMTAS